ncbi:MAG: InlB B-repeat-containing protein [archaeon]
MESRKISLIFVLGLLSIGIFTLTGCIEEAKIPEIDEEYELEIISMEGGMTSPEEGTHNYTVGKEVTVEATPEEGYKFNGWEREGSATQCEQYEETCTFNIMNNSMLSAHFEEIEDEEEYTLGINVIGKGETNPEEGTHTYEEEEEVTITATPDEGWEFKEWQGDYEGTDEEINLLINEDKEITPIFNQKYEDDDIAEECKENIGQAIKYSEEQEICTAEYRELKCPYDNYTYGATDGCQIEYLKQRNWTSVEEEIQLEMVKESTENVECEWLSTNCCPGNAGANWECVNIEETTLECPENPICPQVYVGYPTGECISVNETCMPEEEQEFSGEIE